MVHRYGKFWLRLRELSLYGGIVCVSLWTLIRHLGNGINFDIVGQVGLAEQWQKGVHAGAVLGPTNYLLKMPVYLLFNSLHFISPMNRLLLLALIFNIATYVIIFILAERILTLGQVKDKTALYLGMAWLGVNAGNIYWLEYANSRNLETAGAVLVLYPSLKFMRVKSRSAAILLALTASVVFFADPLQLYIFCLGALLYLAVCFMRSQTIISLRAPAILAVGLFGGAIGSKILALLAKKLLLISYLAVPGSRPAASASSLIHSLTGLVRGVVNIFGANFIKHPYGPNSLRLALNFVFLVSCVLVVVAYLRQKKVRRQQSLVPSLIISSFLVYILSGQALNKGTERYLVMVPILSVILLAWYIPTLARKYQKVLYKVWLGIIIASFILSVGALARAWPTRHAKDQHIYQTLTYLAQHNYRYALGSTGTGIVTTYFSDGQRVVLPVSCPDAHTVRAVTLFYDKGQADGLKQYAGEVPVILQPESERVGVNICTSGSLSSAFGNPLREDKVDGVGTIEIYNSSRIKITPNYNNQ